MAEKPAESLDLHQSSWEPSGENEMEKSHHFGVSETETPWNPNSRPAVFKTTFEEVLCLSVLCLGVCSSSVPEGSYQSSLSDLGDYFDVNGGQLVWSVSAVVLANGSFLLIAGKMADCFGRRRTTLFSLFFYSVVSLIGGFMKNFIALVIMRAIQGLVIAPLVPAGAGIIGTVYPESRRRNLAFAVFSSGGAVGYIIGLLTGGIAVTAFSWKAIQFFLAIVYGITTVVAWFVVPADEPFDREKAKATLKSLDYLGSFLIFTAFTLISFSLTQVDATERGWKTPYIYALLVVGVVLLGAFIVVEVYVVKDPIMPVQIWRNKNFTLCMVIASFTWLTFIGTLGYYPMVYFQDVKHWSALHSALAAMPMGVSGIFVNTFVAVSFHLVSGKMMLIVGNLCLVIAAVIWATYDFDKSYWLGPFWAYTLSCVGADLMYNVCNMVTITSVDESVQSAAAGVFNTILQLAAVVGLSIGSVLISAKDPYYGTIEQNRHEKTLFYGLRNAYYFGIACAGVALAASFFVKVGTQGDKKESSSLQQPDA